MKVTVITITGRRPYTAVVKGIINDEEKLQVTKVLMSDPSVEVTFTEVVVSELPLKPDETMHGLFGTGNAGYINHENLQNGVIEK